MKDWNEGQCQDNIYLSQRVIGINQNDKPNKRCVKCHVAPPPF